MSNIFSPLFLISFIAYVIFLVGEEIVPGFVSNYLNPHWFLIPVFALLIAMVVKDRNIPQESPRKMTGDGLLIFLAGLITVGILWVGANELPSFWRGIITIYGGLITIGILSILFKE